MKMQHLNEDVAIFSRRKAGRGLRKRQINPDIHKIFHRLRKDRLAYTRGAATMSNFIQITPFMHVENLAQALHFFNEILGFETRYRASNYAYIQRETVGFRLLEQTGPDGAPPGNRRFAYYIDVQDVDRLYGELKPKLDMLSKRDVYGPVNQSYGQRELLVLAPDGNLIAFGQAIET